ncbi:MAG: hypothetical protein GY839_03815 [candidate division Zixibacteria bacterium]|nr:hypothetical protein [candidate division Zixibacteria bacterium]
MCRCKLKKTNIAFNMLFNPIFLLALALLLLNDHLLKAAYPGWLTGKLSDFAGLFVMAVFAYAVMSAINRLSGTAASDSIHGVGQTFLSVPVKHECLTYWRRLKLRRII